ncbi:MAG: YetF domain-containing protein [Janthinobacterium lividum]
MKKEDIVFSDWHRWLFGEAPPSFIGETAVRAFVIFAVMVVIMRLMGRRMKGQMSVTELAVVLTLGAVIAGPMQIPTAGLLPSVVVLVALLFMHRFTNWLAYKSRRMELVQQGDAALLLRDGYLDLPAMQRQGLSQEQLFSQLRNKSIAQLGELRRVYFEANGRMSLYKLSEPQPGLSVLPRTDAPPAAISGPAHDKQVCAICGYVPTPTDHAGGRCLRCQAQDWVSASLVKTKEEGKG